MHKDHGVAPVFNGILFIGDAHLASRKPGRRMDDYASAVLAKFEQCARIARERGLYPVFLGDLFHRPGENDLMLLARSMQVLRQFEQPLLVLGGSHDRNESWFTQRDAAYLLQDAGIIELVDQPGLVRKIHIKGQSLPVALWAAPAGVALPDTLEGADPHAHNILITHHDLDFKGPYPGSHALKAIEHCAMLVNGHMHKPAPSVLKGNTLFHNPGSITRVSVDQKDHAPAVSVWTPSHGVSLERVALVVAPNVFDLTGKEVYAASERELGETLPKGLRLSTFAAKLRSGAGNLHAHRTDDGTVLLEELEQYFSSVKSSVALKRYVTAMVQEVVQEKAGV